MDPLSVLREFSIGYQLEQVVIDENRVKFGERYSFPKTVATGYKRHGGGFYDLQTLVYLMKQPSNYAWLTYVRSARDANIPQVAFPDRKELQEYLTGAVEKSDKIQPTAPELVLPMEVDADVEPTAKRAKLDVLEASVSGLNAILDAPPVPLLGKERQLRDRNSQMSVPGKSFKSILEIVHMAQREHATWRNAAIKTTAAAPGHKEKRVIRQMPSGRFDRPAEQRPKGAFKIDPVGAPPLPSGPPPPPSGGPPSGSSRQPQQRPASKAPSKAQTRPGSASKQPPRALRPIIIVPAAPSAKITMLNVKAFLEKGTYVPTEAARKEGAKKEGHLTIYRRLGKAAPVAYEVTDKAPDRKSHDWRRVVAVFVTGAAWQFKDWPYRGAEKGEMAETFHHVLGIHISLKNEQLNDTIKNWNVQRFRLHPHERHGDQPVVMEIYSTIDKFMAKRQKSGKSLEISF